MMARSAGKRYHIGLFCLTAVLFSLMFAGCGKQETAAPAKNMEEAAFKDEVKKSTPFVTLVDCGDVEDKDGEMVLITYLTDHLDGTVED